MKAIMFSLMLFLSVTSSFASAIHPTVTNEGLISISKEVLNDGRVIYVLEAASCAAFPGVSPIVEKINESSVIVKLEVFGPKCTSTQDPVIVKFYLGTLKEDVLRLGLDPENVTFFFNL